VPYTTTVYPAKVALKALLEAHTFPDAAPTISWGAPTEGEDVFYDMIFLGPTGEIEDEYTTLGGDRITEEFGLTVFVDVRMYGDDEQATELRAWQLHDGIMTVLHDNPTLSGTVSRIPRFRRQQVNPIPSPSMWRSQITIAAVIVGYVFPNSP
jgi:hypothetical protein